MLEVVLPPVKSIGRRLRVDEVLRANVAHLRTNRGHQVLTVPGKGNRRAKVPLTPATVVALHAYLDHRTALATAKVSPVQVVGTLRPEFLDQLLADPALAVLPTRVHAAAVAAGGSA